MYYSPLIIIYGYYIFANHKDLVYIMVFACILYFLRLYLFDTTEISQDSSYEIKVINNIKNEEYTSFIGKSKNHYLLVYFDENIEVKPGEVYRVSGVLETPNHETIPYGFSYKNYLLSKNVKTTMFSDDFKLISSKYSIYLLPFYLNQYIEEKCPRSKAYIKTFLLADQSDIDQNIKMRINNIGISHLFAVSGLHITLIVFVIQKVLTHMYVTKKGRERFIVAVLVVYLIITAFAPSITRAALMYFLLMINKKLKLQLSTLDVLSIVFFLLMIQTPYYYYHIGFILSFLITFSIITGHELLNFSGKMKQIFGLSCLSFFVSLPIIVNINDQINLLSLGYNVYFLLLVTYLILPLSYLTFLFPVLDKFYFVSIRLFEKIVLFCEKIDFFTIEMTLRNPILVISYYYFLLMILSRIEQRKSVLRYGILLLLVLTFGNFISWINPYQSVAFIDVEGDSTLIRDRFNQCNMLIDTGESDEYNSVIKYIKSQGISKLDYVFVSHFHSDHYGELNDILAEFSVGKVISRYNAHEYENKMIHCGNIDVFVYGLVYNDENENENSMIMSIFIAKQHYLFVGDSEIKKETEFINKYEIQVDVLKVGHHGSNTSSSLQFLKSINPQTAVIIVDRNNKFNHPSSEIVNRYQELGIDINRTDKDGTIIHRYFFGKLHKKVHSPT